MVLNMEDNVLVWLQKWYLSECDGDWEHENTINIESLANPGWLIKIHLNNTLIEKVEIETIKIDNGEGDWFFYEIKDAVFRAAGDPGKLEFLLLKFKEIVEAANNITADVFQKEQ
jgi:hypothetical protein